jgi:hypothetical protein
MAYENTVAILKLLRVYKCIFVFPDMKPCKRFLPTKVSVCSQNVARTGLFAHLTNEVIYADGSVILM